MYVPHGIKFSYLSPLYTLMFLAALAIGIMLTFFPHKCLKKRPYAGKKSYTFARAAGVIIIILCFAAFFLINLL